MRGFKGGLGLILGIVALGAILGVLWHSCAPPRNDAGTRADSVLQTDTAYQRSVQQQDSLATALDSALNELDRQAKRWRDSVAKLEYRGREIIRTGQAVDSADALRPGLTAHDSIIRLTSSRSIWRTAALHYSQNVVPALHRQIELEARAKLGAMAKAAEMERQRDFARGRANEVTREFQTYRDATKDGIDLGFIRLPEWSDDVALVVGSVALTCAVTC